MIRIVTYTVRHKTVTLLPNTSSLRKRGTNTEYQLTFSKLQKAIKLQSKEKKEKKKEVVLSSLILRSYSEAKKSYFITLNKIQPLLTVTLIVANLIKVFITFTHCRHCVWKITSLDNPQSFNLEQTTTPYICNIHFNILSHLHTGFYPLRFRS